MNRVRSVCRRLLLALLIAIAAARPQTHELHAGQPAHRLAIVKYVRVSRAATAGGDVEFVLRAALHNAGPAIPGASAQLVGVPPGATIVDGDLSFAATGRRDITWSSDTATVRYSGRWADLVRKLEWTIAVAGANRPPVSNAGVDQVANVSQRVVLDGSASSDADGDPLTYAWSWVERPAGSTADLTDPGAVRPEFTVDVPGRYVLSLVVSDATSASGPDVVEVTTANGTPVAHAGADQTVGVGALAQLDGSGSTDPDGDLLTFTWQIVDSPAASQATLSEATAVRPTVTVDVPGTYTVSLVVSDGQSPSPPDLVMLRTGNSPPVADAGTDQAVVAGQIATLDGSGSSDPDGDALGYRWQITSAPGGSLATIADPLAPVITFQADRPGDYVVQLVVNDGQVDGLPDTALVSTSNTAPLANAGVDHPDVAPGTTVALDGSASSDADGHLLTYDWALVVRPQGSSAPLADAASVTPSLTVDVDGEYVAQLIVHDGFVASSPDTVRIRAVTSLPVVTIEEADRNASEVGGDPGRFTIARSGPAGDALDVRVFITGSATNGIDYQTIAGSVTIPAGQLSVGLNVLPLPDADVEGAESVSIAIAAQAGYAIGQPGIAQVLIADGDRPTVTITATTAVASEVGLRAGILTVTRDGATVEPLVVTATRTGTAANGADYASLGGATFAIALPAGASSVELRIEPVADNLVEPVEAVIVTLAPSLEYIVGAPGVATVSIEDSPAVVSLEPVSLLADEEGRQPAVFLVTRSGGAIDLALEVGLTLSGAATPRDFSGVPATVIIPAGRASVDVSVVPTVDNLNEGSELLLIQLAPGGSSYIAGDVGFLSVGIVDDPPMVTVVASDPLAVEGASDNGRFTFARSGGDVSEAMTVFFSRAGSATSGVDYVSVGGAVASVAFPADSATVEVAILALEDGTTEVAETVDVAIQVRGAYEIGIPSQATVTIRDAGETPGLRAGGRLSP